MPLGLNYLSILSRLREGLSRTQGIGDFYRILGLAKRDGINAKVTWIPKDAVSHIRSEEPFDPDYMKPLFEYGYQRMLKDQAWVESNQDTPPSIYNE